MKHLKGTVSNSPLFISERHRKEMRKTLVYKFATIPILIKAIFLRLIFQKKEAIKLEREFKRLQKNPEKLFF